MTKKSLFAINICEKILFGDQLNRLGTSWLGGEGPPRSKIWRRKKIGLCFFNFFERPLLRYLLKSVLHRAALLHCLGLLAAVSQWYIVPTIWGYMSDRGPKDMGTGLDIWIYCHQFGNIYDSWFYIFVLEIFCQQLKDIVRWYLHVRWEICIFYCLHSIHSLQSLHSHNNFFRLYVNNQTVQSIQS